MSCSQKQIMFFPAILLLANMGIYALKNILNAFFVHFSTLHSFDQKTKKLDLGENYFVLNCQVVQDTQQE